jgi:hypothetical protein
MCYNNFFDFGRARNLTVGFTLAKQVLYLETHLQSILLCLLWRWSLRQYLPELALNFYHLSLSLSSS